MPNTRENPIEQRLKNGSESICDKCFHGKVCRAIDNQPCIECNQFIDVNGVTVQSRDCYWATETAYKNGYKQGNADAMKWIPVSERLPPPYTPVLTCRQSFGKNPPYTKVDKMVLLYGDDKVWTDDLGTWKTVVTHWMPLPQPPKGE